MLNARSCRRQRGHADEQVLHLILGLPQRRNRGGRPWRWSSHGNEPAVGVRDQRQVEVRPIWIVEVETPFGVAKTRVLIVADRRMTLREARYRKLGHIVRTERVGGQHTLGLSENVGLTV